MRVEDVGSLTIPGDLMAFSMAMILTIGAMSTLSITNESDERDDTFHEVLGSVLRWEILDPDNDGFLEVPTRNISGTDHMKIFNDLTLIIRFRSIHFDDVFLILNGVMIRNFDSSVRIISPVRTLVVVYEGFDSIFPGIILVSLAEVSS
jgi:hypothetical protein